MSEKCFPKKSVRQKFSDLRNYVKVGCYSVMTSILTSPMMVWASEDAADGATDTTHTAKNMVNNFVSVIGTLVIILGIFFVVAGIVKIVAGHAKEDGPSQDRGMYQTAAGVVLIILPVLLKAFNFAQYVSKWVMPKQ